MKAALTAAVKRRRGPGKVRLTEAERQAHKRASNERMRAAYRGVHSVGIRSILDRDEATPARSYTYDDWLGPVVRRELADRWWRTVVWTYDPKDSDARIICDLCGVDTLMYRPNGGLAICYTCWKATATDEELRAHNKRMAEKARVRKSTYEDHGLSRFEMKPMPSAHAPLEPPNPRLSTQGRLRQELMTAVADRFGLHRPSILRATSASARAAMAFDDPSLLQDLAARPVHGDKRT